MILVSFTPTALGTRVAQIQIVSNAPPSVGDPNIVGSPHFVALTGNSIPEPDGSGAPAQLGIDVDATVLNLAGILINPVTVTYTVNGCFQREMFLVLNAPAMGIPWAYLNTAGKFVPLPANLAQITPFMASGPPGGTYVLFNGTVPPGKYELYLGCDNVLNGRLDIDVGLHVNGIYDYLAATVK